MPFDRITDEDHRAFWEDGYVFKGADFSRRRRWRRARRRSAPIRRSGSTCWRSTTMPAARPSWRCGNHPSEDVFGAIARSERVAGGAERLLGGEVYHYHSKLMMKAARRRRLGMAPGLRLLVPERLPVSGHAPWRSRSTRRRGERLHAAVARQPSAGTDRARASGGQTGADPERVEQAMKRLSRRLRDGAGRRPLLPQQPLHCSAANLSAKPRNLLICCYNKATNNPYKAPPPPAIHEADAAGRRGRAAGRRKGDRARLHGRGRGRHDRHAQGRLTPATARNAPAMDVTGAFRGCR